MTNRILMMGLTPPLEGGSQRHIYELSSRIENCTVLTQKGTICKKNIEIPLIHNPLFVRNVMFFFFSMVYSLFLLIVPRKKYDLVHIHENLLFFAAPILRLRYKVVITAHGMEGFSYYDNKFIWFIFRAGLLFANKIVAVNLEDKKILDKYFRNVTYIPNGVDLDPYKKVRTEVTNKIGFIGRVHEQKGVIYLLQAFEIVRKKYPKFKLEIIGEVNEYARDLQRQFPNGIIWKGFLKNREEIAKSLKSSYCIALPSLWEGLPLTLFESLASGRPVVVSDIPAFKSVVKDEAIFSKVKDSRDLAEKIIILIKDKKKANEIGKSGYELSKKYEWGEIAKNLEDFYERV